MAKRDSFNMKLPEGSVRDRKNHVWTIDGKEYPSKRAYWISQNQKPALPEPEMETEEIVNEE